MKTFRILAIALVVLFFSCSKEEEDDDPTPKPNPVGCFDQQSYTDQLPNFDFEDWGYPDSSNGQYQEPCGGVWTSSNAAAVVLSPDLVNVSKTANAQSGSSAVEVTTKAFAFLGQSITVPGFFFCGRYKNYNINIFDPIKSVEFGVPFTERPVSLKGFQMYTSVNGDSAYIAVMISKYNFSADRKDTLGFGELTISQSSSAYSEFDLNIEYAQDKLSLVPDSIVVLYTSSKAYESLEGEEGSTLLIDNCSFVY